MPGGGAGKRPGDTLLSFGNGQVEIVDIAVERRGPHGSADHPDPLGSLDRLAGQAQSRRPLQALLDRHSRTRGTRAEIPQVIS